jgi:hypothetical protein
VTTLQAAARLERAQQHAAQRRVELAGLLVRDHTIAQFQAYADRYEQAMNDVAAARAALAERHTWGVRP